MNLFKRKRLLSIGDRFQGGLIAHLFEEGEAGFIRDEPHGLIVASDDQSSGISWINEYKRTAATGISIGSGIVNTKEIISYQSPGSYAAKLCFDLSLEGYHDWFLPSRDELNKLFINRAAIGNFLSQFYWSSTQFGYNCARNQNLGDGSTGTNYRSSNLCVRAVRIF